MSVDAWVIATVDHLRTQLVDIVPGGAPKAYGFIDVQPGGKPPPRSGPWYIAVDEGGTQNVDKSFLNEVYTVLVTISLRTGVYAADRYGELYRKNATNLRKLERRVIKAIHDNQTLRAAVNVELSAPHVDHGDATLTPMWYVGRQPTFPAGPEWALSTADNDVFLVRVLRFQGGRRVQMMDVAG